MAFVTYVLLVGLQLGIDSNKAKTVFSPDVFGLTATSCIFIIFAEILVLKFGASVLAFDAPILDLLCYCGYQFMPYAKLI